MASTTCTLGIDIGTFESKGVLVRVCDGAILARASRPHPLHVPAPGYAEHDAEADWWGALVHLTRALLASSGISPACIACLAVSAIGPALVPTDASGAALHRAILYGVDTRASAQIAALEAALGRQAILARAGNALTSQSVGPKILWLQQERPDVYARAHKFVPATTFLTQRLTGGQCCMDHLTAAGFAPLYNVHTQQWEALAGEGVPGIVELERLPKLAWATELLPGGVCAAAAAATGLAPGTPVTVGTIDAAAEAVSVGVVTPGDAMLMYGSTMFTVNLTAAMPTRLDGVLWYAPWLFPGTHSLNAGQATSGTLTHWFRSTLCGGSSGGSGEGAEGRGAHSPPTFEALVAEAAASPRGAKGLLCLPYFSGERTPLHDPLAVGSFFGLTLAHSRGDMFRAVLEGIACGTAHIFEALGGEGAGGESAAPGRRVRAVGGGTQNAVWMQATSDFSGCVQDVCQVTVGASFGDAFLAALAVGAVSGVEAIHSWNPVVPGATVAPAPPALRAGCERQYRLWKALYAQTKDIAHALRGGE